MGDWFAYALLGLDPASHLGQAVQFFVFVMDTAKIFFLLVAIIYVMGMLRAMVSPERVLFHLLKSARKRLTGPMWGKAK
ncbi:hypothetical protein [Sulfurivirga caldicuralii]|uniref:hypothetical protein n=1 Tax=Sulfurivirga caldicuralii TaxID=364032 RepID=UPI00190E61AF|nr:hypothetical protein [Sulfurivirga caldicuralii]